MLQSYFTTAFRSLLKRKWVSLINILGLSVGMAAGLLSYLHIRHELSFDNFHSNSGRIYRIVTGDVKTGEGWVGISAPIPPKLKNDIPEIEDFVRLTKLKRDGKVVIRYLDNSFNEENFFLADASLFSVFDFPLVEGNARQALEDVSGIIVSESKALKLFGKENPIGKTLTVNDEFEFRVTGLMKDVPSNSHIDFDFVVSFLNLEKLLPGTSLDGNWGQYNYYGYALLRPGVDKTVVDKKIQSISIPLKDYTHSLEKLSLQPLADIHFQHNRGNLKQSYNFKYLFIYAAAALGLILISLVNFVNLKTAGSSKRVKEVGVRKVIGAGRPQLVGQFILETSLLSIFSLIAAIFLVESLFLPYVNDLFGVDMGIDLFSPLNLSLGLSFAIVISLIAGGYIAFFVTSFSPVRALKSQVKTGSGKSVLRNTLLGIQFLVSIILIASSLVISRQLNYISEMNLGLNPAQIINVPLYTQPDTIKAALLKKELLNLPGVQSVSTNRFNPGTVNWNQTVWWEGQEEEESMYIIAVDPDFFETMGIELMEGDPEYIRKNIRDRYTYVLNESAVKHIGWETASGKLFSPFGDDARKPITGVIKDFYYQSLHNQVKPCLLVVGNLSPSQLYVKIPSAGINQAISAIQEKFAQILPGLPFEYTFLDEEFAQLYQVEQTARKVISFYTLVSILLALFGLYGLLTFEVNERTKELAIRKILGGNMYHLSTLLSKNFIRIVLAASVLGIPLTWWLMSNWLRNFNYRIEVNFFTMILPLLMLVFIIGLIVSMKIWGVSRNNPVEELRYE